MQCLPPDAERSKSRIAAVRRHIPPSNAPDAHLFVGNFAVEGREAIEIAVGRARVETSEFVRNIASVGGAVIIVCTAELVNSTFSDNESVEGEGSAISNVGIILEMAGLSFSANRFLYDDTEYICMWSSARQVSRFYYRQNRASR